MDILPSNETLTVWLLNYGSISLFFLLIFGIIALPIPEETLMVLAGVAIFQGKLNVIPTLLAAYGGSICGITVSYLLGRTFGHWLILKWGPYIGIGEAHLTKAHVWFEKYGKWSLVIGYFIPGVRHFTGFCAGTTELEYKHFAVYAYLGAFLWVSTFISVGYFFGNYGFKFFKEIDVQIDSFTIVLTIALALFAYFAFKKET